MYHVFPKMILSMILGSDSIDNIKRIIKESSSVFWNGPLGYVEKNHLIGQPRS